MIRSPWMDSLVMNMTQDELSIREWSMIQSALAVYSKLCPNHPKGLDSLIDKADRRVSEFTLKGIVALNTLHRAFALEPEEVAGANHLGHEDLEMIS